MKRLYAPWRTNYTRSIHQSKNSKAQEADCIFCNQRDSQKKSDHFILGSYRYTFVLLNLYPYNAGHLLLVPYTHNADLYTLTREERSELIELTSIAQKILKQVLAPQGFNIGLNQGKAAGAGIPSHLHMHIVPRWIGDTNFLPIIADTKQISVNLHELYHQLLPSFKEITI